MKDFYFDESLILAICTKTENDEGGCEKLNKNPPHEKTRTETFICLKMRLSVNVAFTHEMQNFA